MSEVYRKNPGWKQGSRREEMSKKHRRRKRSANISRYARNNIIAPRGPLPIKSEPFAEPVFWVGLKFLSAAQNGAP